MTPARPTATDIMSSLERLEKALATQGKATDTNLWHEMALLRKDIDGRLERIEDGMCHREKTCPLRDEIKQVSMNVTRLNTLEQRVEALEHQAIRAGMLPGAAGGGVGALVTGVIMLIGKYLSWW